MLARSAAPMPGGMATSTGLPGFVWTELRNRSAFTSARWLSSVPNPTRPPTRPKLGRTSPQVAPTRAELIAMGLLYTPQHGYAAFTVPHFDSFMKRAMPELVLPIRAAGEGV